MPAHGVRYESKYRVSQMSLNTAVMFEKASDEWETPEDFLVIMPMTNPRHNHCFQLVTGTPADYAFTNRGAKVGSANPDPWVVTTSRSCTRTNQPRVISAAPKARRTGRRFTRWVCRAALSATRLLLEPLPARIPESSKRTRRPPVTAPNCDCRWVTAPVRWVLGRGGQTNL